jgi:DNA-nicking Smr family endonuclease
MNDSQKEKLDLHGTKYDLARSKVIRFIEDNWHANLELEIITGHSKKMKYEYGLKYRIGDFAGLNKGFISIPMDHNI